MSYRSHLRAPQRASLYRAGLAVAISAVLLSTAACRRNRFPSYPENYREFAYVSDGGGNTVTVLDLIYLRRDKTLEVGKNPTGLAANPVRNEVYVVNTDSDSVTVINTELNRVEATIGVHHKPYFIAVSPDGKRAYVPNSGSNNISVIDLDSRREVATVATGEGPGMAKITEDGKTLVVSNRVAGSLSVYNITAEDKQQPISFRASFNGCPGATDVVVEADSPDYPAFGSKAFVACSAGHQVMDVWLAADANSYRGKQDATLTHDFKLALLDVGQSPTHLTLKPGNTEVFASNFDSDSISEISTYTNEVEGTYVIGSKPTHGIATGWSQKSVIPNEDSVWISSFGGDAVSVYSVGDGRMMASVKTGSKPDALAFSSDEHLLLVADAGSADVAVIRTQPTTSPTLVTLLPAGPQPNDLLIKSFTLKK
ncbi:YncE family protein [Granulicella cerasi]|uniref:YncE family protein n=1 Tax=Granulicella cerasi TaxID=741063 RepID=A0ABW1Z8Q1_9BACT|nr:YncE family protein [Granulicella cerasi]